MHLYGSTILSDKYATVLLGLCQGSGWINNPMLKGDNIELIVYLAPSYSGYLCLFLICMFPSQGIF